MPGARPCPPFQGLRTILQCSGIPAPKAPSSALTGNLHVCWKLSCPSLCFMLSSLRGLSTVNAKGKLCSLLWSRIPCGIDGWGFSRNHTESQLCPFPVLSPYSVRTFLSSPENTLPINLLNTHPRMGTCFHRIQTEMLYEENFMMRIWSIMSELWENVNMIQYFGFNF